MVWVILGILTGFASMITLFIMHQNDGSPLVSHLIPLFSMAGKPRRAVRLLVVGKFLRWSQESPLDRFSAPGTAGRELRFPVFQDGDGRVSDDNAGNR